jgi:hypothetical protein
MDVRCTPKADCPRSSARSTPAIPHGFAADLPRSGISRASSGEIQRDASAQGVSGRMIIMALKIDGHQR